jgi:glycosyltransferase involved in cell wall biosynthesis
MEMLASSSYREGFPNAVAEAMACARPCVVTNIGDPSRIVGEFGIVVPPRDAAALADGINDLRMRLERDGLAFTRQVRELVKKLCGQQALINASVECLGNSPACNRGTTTK